MSDLLAYWWLIICRATSSTYECFGGWRFFVLPPLIFLIGIFLHWIGILRWPALERMAGKPLNQLFTYAIYGVVAVAIACAAVETWNLFSVPQKLHAETKEKAAAATAKLESEKAPLENRYDSRSDLRASSTSEQVEELKEENQRLKTELGNRKEKLDRLVEVRSVMLLHADVAPSESEFTRDRGRSWLDAAEVLVNASVKYDRRNPFKGFPPSHDYSDVEKSATSLRALAVNLKVEDLID